MEVIDLKNRIDPIKLAYKFHETMLNQKLMLVYEGEMSQEITTSFTAMAERNLDNSSDDEYTKYKRLYHVMVECLQNICKHADDSDINFDENRVNYGTGILMISQYEGNFVVTTGNAISNTVKDGIKSSIDKINAMDKSELKEYYKQRMRESRISDKGGAGLGFIDMVKKTGNKLEYTFEEINDEKSFFILKTTVS